MKLGVPLAHQMQLTEHRVHVLVLGGHGMRRRGCENLVVIWMLRLGLLVVRIRMRIKSKPMANITGSGHGRRRKVQEMLLLLLLLVVK